MSLAAQLTSTGIVVPSYEDILAQLEIQFRAIYGADAYIAPDSQDGQLLAVFAAAINDTNQMAASIFNSFSPSTAQGAGLSSNVKINGLRRLDSSNSTVNVLVVGQVGTIINSGIVADLVGNQWNLPATVTIPIAGEITVTATAVEEGSISAAPSTVTRIVTPTRGWQSVNNVAAATEGDPVESDATLRIRQAVSTALPAQTVLDAIVGVVANVSGVQRYAAYENDTDATDGNGIPSHSISLVVGGGDSQEIGDAIAIKKAPGTGTYGTTTVETFDARGLSNDINFFVLDEVGITVEIDATALAGYVVTTGDLLKAAVAAAINALDIGTDVYYLKLYAPANLSGDAATDSSGMSQAALDLLSKTYNVTAIRISRTGPPAAGNVAIAFNEAAACTVNDISLAVT